MTIIITLVVFMIITMVRVHMHQLNNNRKESRVLESCFIMRANHNISRANALNGLQIQSDLLQRALVLCLRRVGRSP